MTLSLSTAQQAEILPHLKPGCVLICKVTREMFTGENTMTSGNLILDFVTVPETALAAIREIIRTSK